MFELSSKAQEVARYTFSRLGLARLSMFESLKAASKSKDAWLFAGGLTMAALFGLEAVPHMPANQSTASKHEQSASNKSLASPEIATLHLTEEERVANIVYSGMRADPPQLPWVNSGVVGRQGEAVMSRSAYSIVLTRGEAQAPPKEGASDDQLYAVVDLKRVGMNTPPVPVPHILGRDATQYVLSLGNNNDIPLTPQTPRAAIEPFLSMAPEHFSHDLDNMQTLVTDSGYDIGTNFYDYSNNGLGSSEAMTNGPR